MTPNNYYFIGPSHNVETFGGNAKAILGQVNSPSPVNRAGLLPPSMATATKVTERNASVERGYDEGSGSNLSHEDESISALGQRFDELTLDAVSFQIERHQSVRNKSNVEERRCEPREEHYNDDKHGLRKGDIVRIWHPVNREMHLTTFLIISVEGNDMTCLRIVHGDPEEVEFPSLDGYGKLKVERRIPGVSRRTPNVDSDSFRVFMSRSQNIKEHCWINMLNSENIDKQKEYKFVRCGQLDDSSLERVKEDHLRLYRAKLR
ncbi:MAG: hypothetical protein Q9165_005472 [Trypethelium subeluteriae]